MAASSFLNTFTSGEVSDDAWDRNDIQPIAKGCMEATNLVLRIAGPLGKRRGFWDISAVADQTKLARLIPFRRSIDDALMLELGDLTCRVWQANGAPLLNGGVQVNFATPWSQAQLAGLRFKQVADVIYVRHATGLQPHAIVRQADSSWIVNAEGFPNGPWLPENDDDNKQVTVTATSGTTYTDNVASTGAGCITAGANVTLVANTPIFFAGQSYFRFRQSSGQPGVKTWSTGARAAAGNFCASAGRVYICAAPGTGPLVNGVDQAVTTPPVQTVGAQSDGGNMWDYLNDGAGVVQITAITDSTHATGVVMRAIPLNSGASTKAYAESAYSDYRGWPRTWPSIVEERLAGGATVSNLDMLDMTETAGFDTVSETFTPGLGNGTVVDTDAIRRRVGDDGAEILWSIISTFLLVGTASGEYVASGGLFGSPITPSSIVVRQIGDYGSEDVYPARAHKGLFFVTRGGQAVRKLTVDLQQNIGGDDVSFLATHISKRRFAQLAWVPYPDEVLWARLGDGGLAALTDHEEQEVRGWTRQQLGGGFIVEDIVTLPGPGRLETLWAIVSRQKDGATQRRIWMMSQPSDGLFIDGAQLYDGAPATDIAGLGMYNNETVRVLADGVMYDRPCVGVSVLLPQPASVVQAGLGYPTRFQSLTLDLGAIAAALNLRQRPTQLVAHLKTTSALVSVAGGGPGEVVGSRTAANVPAAASQPIVCQPTLAASTSRAPTIVIAEDTAYDHVIYSLKPVVAIGG